MTDQIDLSTVQIHSSPDVREWARTVTITGVHADPRGGLKLLFDRPIPDSWKWASNPAAPAENFQYTVWLVVPIGGQYHAQGLIQMWQGRAMGDGSLPSILQHYGSDGWLGGLGGLMQSYHPIPLDRIGVFVTAGNARNFGTVSSVAERSNVVAFPLDDEMNLTFATDPTPGPTPQPEPTPAPVDRTDDILAAVKASEDRILARIDAFENDAKGLIKQLSMTVAIRNLFGK